MKNATIMDNTLITFGIPTYNRADFVDELLAHMFNELELFNYPVIISDNCSSDNTREIVLSYQKKYSNITYYRQETNISADNNFLFIQDLVQSKYFWFIGDGVRFFKNEMSEILKIVSNNDYSALIMNYYDRVSNIDSCIYSGQSKLLTDLGWHASQMSALIYSKEMFDERVPALLCENSWFNYYSRFFRYLGETPFIKVYWHSKNSFTFSKLQKENSWHQKIVEVWIKSFSEAVLSLPVTYSLNSKLHSLKSYGRSHSLFKLETVIAYTIKGFYSPSDIVKYKNHFAIFMPLNWRVYYLISRTPKAILTTFLKIYSFLRRIKSVLTSLIK